MLVRLLFLMGWCVFCVKANALYNGNPSGPMMPEYGFWIPKEAPVGLKVGYEIDWTYSCPLELHLQNISKGHTDRYHSLVQWGVITMNVMDRVELFTSLGAMDCHWTQSFSGHQMALDFSSGWAWSIGGKILLAYWGDLQLGANASYVQARPALCHLKVDGQSFSQLSSTAHVNPWQVGAGISYRFGWFLPYVAVDYMQLQIDVDHLPELAGLVSQQKLLARNTYSLGLVIGMGIGLQQGMDFNIEARFLNEDSLALNADLKF